MPHLKIKGPYTIEWRASTGNNPGYYFILTGAAHGSDVKHVKLDKIVDNNNHDIPNLTHTEKYFGPRKNGKPYHDTDENYDYSNVWGLEIHSSDTTPPNRLSYHVHVTGHQTSGGPVKHRHDKNMYPPTRVSPPGILAAIYLYFSWLLGLLFKKFPTGSFRILYPVTTGSNPYPLQPSEKDWFQPYGSTDTTMNPPNGYCRIATTSLPDRDNDYLIDCSVEDGGWSAVFCALCDDPGILNTDHDLDGQNNHNVSDSKKIGF